MVKQTIILVVVAVQVVAKVVVQVVVQVVVRARHLAVQTHQVAQVPLVRIQIVIQARIVNNLVVPLIILIN